MPNTGTSPTSSRTISRSARQAAPGRRARSRGTRRRGCGRARRPRQCEAGTTSTRQPTPTRWRRIVRLIPKSYATTRNGASSSPDGIRLIGVVTVATRSMPSVERAVAAAARTAASSVPKAPGKRAFVAEVPGEATGVDPGDAGHVVFDRAGRRASARRASCSGDGRDRAPPRRSRTGAGSRCRRRSRRSCRCAGR